jgi:hypothetical protein
MTTTPYDDTSQSKTWYCDTTKSCCTSQAITIPTKLIQEHKLFLQVFFQCHSPRNRHRRQLVPPQDSNASNWDLATRTTQALNSIIPAELSSGAIAGIVIGTARVIVLISVTASVVFVRRRVSHFAMSPVNYRTNSPIAEQNFFYRNETEALQW